MNSCQSRSGRLLAIWLVLLIPLSCGRAPLPDVPAFEKLGFANALEVVQRQVLAAYEQWQESPRDPDRNGHLGMLLSVYGKNSASEVFYRRARILEPGEFRWTYYLAIALLDLARYEEAAEMFRMALEIDPAYVEARIRLAGLLLQINSIDESIDLYQEITEKFPARIEGWLGLGKALDRSGDLVAATAALKRARIVGPQYGEVHYAFAAVLAASGDEAGAADELAAYERTATNTIRTVDPLVQDVLVLHAGDGPHMASADRHMRYGRLNEAVASFRAALVANPANQDAWSGLVHTQAMRGKLDEARDTYNQALAAGVSYARLHLTFGRALLEQQQLDEARDVIGKAIELDPQYAEALSVMGELEMQSGAPGVAVEQFRRSLVAAPNDRQVAMSLAKTLNAAGQFEEAASRLESLSADPDVDRSLALKELAIAYHGLDRQDKAIDALQQARETALKSADTSMVNEIDALLAAWRAD